MGQVIITKLNGGLGVQATSADGTSGFIFAGVAASIVGGAQLDTVYELNSLKDAESLLINAAYDTANTTVLYRHLKDFYRLNPAGKLYIILVTDTNTAAMETATDKLVTVSNGEVRTVAISFADGSTVDAALAATITALQAKAESVLSATDAPIIYLLEGRVLDDSVDLTALNSPRVAVVAGQDVNISAVTETKYSTLVGLCLGAIAQKQVHENIGHVQSGNMLGGDLLQAAIGGASFDPSLAINLEAAGYIFLKQFNGFAGWYWNDSFTCTDKTQDDYYSIENNRVWDKAYRLQRVSMLPYVNGTINVDADTGQLPLEVAKSFEQTARRSLDVMEAAGEISGAEVFVDPEQNILSTEELVFASEIVPVGIGRTLRGTIGFNNPLS